ncbi:MAG: hypothetical protein ACR2PL_25085, partial [Dehalococcoidia bacterium]
MTAIPQLPPWIQLASTTPDSPAWRAVQHAFAATMGHSRLLLYDLPSEDAPRRTSRSGISLEGSGRWLQYLANRRHFDDGRLTLLVALRRLGAEERLLAIDWGSAYANTFLLIEPSRSDVDLTDAGHPSAARVRAAAESVLSGSDPAMLARVLRELYGSWVYWPGAPAGEHGYRRIDVSLSD